VAKKINSSSADVSKVMARNLETGVSKAIKAIPKPEKLLEALPLPKAKAVLSTPMQGLAKHLQEATGQSEEEGFNFTKFFGSIKEKGLGKAVKGLFGGEGGGMKGLASLLEGVGGGGGGGLNLRQLAGSMLGGGAGGGAAGAMGAVAGGMAAMAGPIGLVVAALPVVAKAMGAIGAAPFKVIGSGLKAVSGGLRELEGDLGPIGAAFGILEIRSALSLQVLQPG
jgi:hypothetical protein